MTPGKYDLTIYCGSTWNEDSVKFVYKIEGQPVNLTGYTARAVGTSQWDGRPYFDISSSDGSLILGGAAGSIAPSLSALQTSAMWRQNIPTSPASDGTLVGKAGTWSLEITSSSGVTTRILEGTLLLSPEVVRG